MSPSPRHPLPVLYQHNASIRSFSSHLASTLKNPASVPPRVCGLPKVPGPQRSKPPMIEFATTIPITIPELQDHACGVRIRSMSVRKQTGLGSSARFGRGARAARANTAASGPTSETSPGRIVDATDVIPSIRCVQGLRRSWLVLACRRICASADECRCWCCCNLSEGSSAPRTSFRMDRSTRVWQGDGTALSVRCHSRCHCQRACAAEVLTRQLVRDIFKPSMGHGLCRRIFEGEKRQCTQRVAGGHDIGVSALCVRAVYVICSIANLNSPMLSVLVACLSPLYCAIISSF